MSVWAPISLHEVPVTNEYDSGLLNEITYFGSSEPFQFALPLVEKPCRHPFQKIVHVTRMTHNLANAAVQVLENGYKRRQIQETCLRDAIKSHRSDQCRSASSNQKRSGNPLT